MKLQTIGQLKKNDLAGKKVLLRLDLNVPLEKGEALAASDLWKIRSSLPTIDYLLHQGAALIILSHLGRPDGKKIKRYSLRPVIKKLAEMIGHKITLWDYPVSGWQAKTKKLRPHEVVALENIRFHPGEEKNDVKLSKQLAGLADLYVDDAFGNIERAHASMLGVTKYLPSYAGFLVQKELAELAGLLKHSKHPIVAIMGGSKISTKIGLIKHLLTKVDYLLLGGALANDVLQSKDIEVGKSLVDPNANLLNQFIMNNRLKLPVDARVGVSTGSKKYRISAIGRVRPNELILDLGPDTVELYSAIIRKAKTVIWNGPLGYFENPVYAWSTKELAKVIANSHAREYVGGGETVKAVLQNRLEDKLHFVSSGGGAMLAVLEQAPLPALRPLIR